MIRISFAEGRLFNAEDLTYHIHVEIEQKAERLQVEVSERPEGVHVQFRQLIERSTVVYSLSPCPSYPLC